MTVQRKKPPEHVTWDQVAILRRIADLEVAITSFTHTSGTPGEDDSAVIVKNPSDNDFLRHLADITIQLKLLNMGMAQMIDHKFVKGDE